MLKRRQKGQLNTKNGKRERGEEKQLNTKKMKKWK